MSEHELRRHVDVSRADLELGAQRRAMNVRAELDDGGDVGFRLLTGRAGHRQPVGLLVLEVDAEGVAAVIVARAAQRRDVHLARVRLDELDVRAERRNELEREAVGHSVVSGDAQGAEHAPDLRARGRLREGPLQGGELGRPNRVKMWLELHRQRLHPAPRNLGELLVRGEVLDVLRQLRARAEQEGDDVRGLRPRNRHRCVSEGSGGRVYNGDEHVLEDVVWSQPLIWSIRPISEQQFELCEGTERVVCPAAERGRGDEGEAGHGCWQQHSRVKEHVVRAEKPVCCVHLGRGMAEKSACVLDAVRLPPVQVPRSVRSTEEGRHARWGQGPPDVTIRELWVERGETRREQYVGYLPMRDDAVAARDRS